MSAAHQKRQEEDAEEDRLEALEIARLKAEQEEERRRVEEEAIRCEGGWGLDGRSLWWCCWWQDRAGGQAGGAIQA